MTVIFASPLAWKSFWPLRDLEIDLDLDYRPLREFQMPDERAAIILFAVALCLWAVPVITSIFTKHAGKYVSIGEVRVMSSRANADELVTEASNTPFIKTDTSTLDSASLAATDEKAGPHISTSVSATTMTTAETTTITWHFARRPRHLLRPKPKKLKLNPNLSRQEDSEETWDWTAIVKKEKRLRSVPWRSLRQERKEGRPGELDTAGAQNTAEFDEHHDATPAATPMDTGPPPTPDWARVGRSPPTPLSAATLDNFIAPKGPGNLVMQVQSIAS